MPNKIEVRDLKAKDVFTVSKMLLKVTGKAKDQIFNLITADDVKEKIESKEELTGTEQVELGIKIAYEVLSVCLEHAENDLKEWFADLIGVTAEEFDEMSFDTPMIIIEKVVTKEEAKSFFTRAFALFKKMKK
ncbi:hypothetical protein MWH25_01430 [Natroniella acetigena]|uniref:hypothetical protein n=1 Tax=Natroniella acetigena TaxID=52004 RepID=UPI002009E08D|nr:hypothetical protein [Natroniella acetigena]MCK8826409.1 hypothetical protein [Natroniella acetigena]